MKNATRQRAVETAMRRRCGASKHHSDKVRTHMLSQDDLYTTCQACGQGLKGTLDAIMQHGGACKGGSHGL